MSYHDDAASIGRAHASLERHYQAGLEADIQSPDTMADEEDRWLADLDTFNDWMAQHTPATDVCIKHCDHLHVPHDEVDRQSYIDALDPPQLLTLAMQWPSYAGAAMTALTDKYLAYRRAAQ